MLICQLSEKVHVQRDCVLKHLSLNVLKHLSLWAVMRLSVGVHSMSHWVQGICSATTFSNDKIHKGKGESIKNDRALFFQMRNSAFPALSCPFIASYNVSGIVGAAVLGLHSCMDQPFSIPYCICAIPQHSYPTLHFFCCVLIFKVSRFLMQAW